MRIAYIPAKKGLWLKVDIKGVTNGYLREAVAAIESMRPI
jgi:hypothetical protein